jgi:Flp pilus assembly pilin Flp
MVLAQRRVLRDPFYGMRQVCSFLRDELGQDLSENLLLVAFVALVSTAIYLSAGNSIGGIWSQSSSQLTAAASANAGSPANSDGGNGGNGGDDRHGCGGDDRHGCH